MTYDLTLYRLGMRMATPILPLYVRRRLKQNKEHPERYKERYGKTLTPRPSGPLVWLHAASVGESIMLLPLLRKFIAEQPGTQLLLTTGTLTTSQVMKSQLPDGVIHQFSPADCPKFIDRFLNHWKPDLAVLAESEIWPNLILRTRALGIPTALINARMSKTSLNSWAKRKKASAHIFGGFDTIIAADALTAERLSELSGHEVILGGNLKYAAQPLKVSRRQFTLLKNQTEGRTIWAAASTHHGEEGFIAQMHSKLLQQIPDALLLLAPRHPERANVIKAILGNENLSVAQRSLNEPITADTQVYLFDTLGEMGLVYYISPVSVVCGSLTQSSAGHNPLEATRLGSAVISGSNISSFSDIYDSLIEANAVRVVKDTPEFETALFTLLTDEPARAAQAKSARKLARAQDGVLDTIWKGLSPFMPDSGTNIETSN